MFEPNHQDRIEALELLAERVCVVFQTAHRQRGLTAEEIYILQHANEITGGRYGKTAQAKEAGGATNLPG